LAAVLARRDVGHERNDGRAIDRHRQQHGDDRGDKQRQCLGHRHERKRDCRNRRADEDERHPPPDGRADSIRKRADGRLDEQRSNVVQRHDKANEARLEAETLRKKNRHKGVIDRPQHADAEKAKAEKKRLGVIEFHERTPGEMCDTPNYTRALRA
jgi:hypothetical protein